MYMQNKKKISNNYKNFSTKSEKYKNYDIPHTKHRANKIHEYNENSMQPYPSVLWREL